MVLISTLRSLSTSGMTITIPGPFGSFTLPIRNTTPRSYWGIIFKDAKTSIAISGTKKIATYNNIWTPSSDIFNASHPVFYY
jgi:hypothetical protein